MPDLDATMIPLSTILGWIFLYYVVGTILCCCVLEIFGIIGLRHDLPLEWPPIADDKFVKLCTPGTDPQIAVRVRHIIAEQLGVPAEHIHPDMNFINDLGC